LRSFPKRRQRDHPSTSPSAIRRSIRSSGAIDAYRIIDAQAAVPIARLAPPQFRLDKISKTPLVVSADDHYLFWISSLRKKQPGDNEVGSRATCITVFDIAELTKMP
jgi:hypothetical protein